MMKYKNNKYFFLSQVYQHVVLHVIEHSFDIIQILSVNLAWLYLLHSKEEYDVAEVDREDELSVLPTTDLYDSHKAALAMKEIRDAEAREFGQVDASTHRDVNRVRLNQDGELMQMADGAKAHPVLAKEAYFSGDSDLNNNPLTTNNPEAQERHLEHQLRNQLQLQQKQENVNLPRFNPTPHR